MKYFLVLVCMAAMLVGCGKKQNSDDNQNKLIMNMKGKTLTINLDEKLNPAKTYIADIKTNLGTIQVELYNSQTPKTVKNFVLLSKAGFYNGLTFHRVIDKFMIQGGDPAGNGGGGASIYGEKFEDEIIPSLTFEEPGVLAMANSGANTNNSQFFITVAPQNRLNGGYTIFGKVINGFDIAVAISKVKKDAKDKPIFPVIIDSITISEK
ncbi:MAG: peptidylprolyl isomerase [Bacteroidota bacterium]|nr:peptidylprolyl isomerase [Bacteroidota bacterium]